MDLWSLTSYVKLLEQFAAAVGPGWNTLSPDAQRVLREYAGRVWMTIDWSEAHDLSQRAIDLVPSVLPSTYPCPGRCCV